MPAVKNFGVARGERHSQRQFFASLLGKLGARQRLDLFAS